MPGDRARWIRTWLPTAAAVLACAALLGHVQFAFDGLRDPDSYFHTRAARELADHGFRDTFPQTAYSTWSVRYSDKDLLFHVLLIPFQWLAGPERLVLAGKWAAVAFDLAVFAALAAALHALRVRHAWFWIALYFTMDVDRLAGLLVVRPGVLAVGLVLVELALLVRSRPWALALAGALHAWSHSSFVLLPWMALAACAAPLLRGERARWKLLAAACAGPVAANVLHPYFPNNLHLAWDQLVQVGLAVWLGTPGIPRELFGAELLPAQTSQFLSSCPGYLPAAAGVVAFLAHGGRRLSTGGLALLGATAALLVPAFLSERFLHFFFPAAIVFGARMWSELAGDAPLLERLRSSRRAKAAAAMLVICPLAGLSAGGVPALLHHVRTAYSFEVLRPGIAFLREAAPPGELVYHHFWWDFPLLYHYRPDGRYVEALDPVFFHRHDPRRFARAIEVWEGRADDAFGILREDFGARWVFLPKAERYYPFFESMRADPRFRKAYEDEHVVIARLP